MQAEFYGVLPVTKGIFGPLQQNAVRWGNRLKQAAAVCNGLTVINKSTVVGEEFEQSLFKAVEARFKVVAVLIYAVLMCAVSMCRAPCIACGQACTCLFNSIHSAARPQVQGCVLKWPDAPNVSRMSHAAKRNHMLLSDSKSKAVIVSAEP